MIRITTWAVLALGVTLSITASDARTATTDVVQTINFGSSDMGASDDNITVFLAVVANGGDQPAKNRDNGHQDHLGLGFAHGMANGKLHENECHGNGHERHGNSLGYRDCGDPSPSD